MKKYLSIAFFVICFSVGNSSYILAEENQNRVDEGEGVADVITDSVQGKLDKSKFSGNIDLGSNLSFWQPGLDDEKVVEFDTEGLKTFNISGNVVYEGKSFLSFGYESPLNKTSRQEEIFKTNTSQEAGLEKFTWGIKLDPFADYFFPDKNFGGHYSG